MQFFFGLFLFYSFVFFIIDYIKLKIQALLQKQNIYIFRIPISI